MAGTINLALSQQFDMDGEPLSGGLLYFFVASTTNPANSFQDIGLTIVNPNPIVLDASGRVPMFYLADGFIKIRLADKNGVTVIAADQLLVIGPSSGGGGGGGGVDVTTVLATGDIKARYGTGTLDGFVPCNGRSIGQTGSSATELAGPKTQALYEYLWAFPNIAIDGGSKGANANADFLLLKPLVLPDLRGRVIAGLDDMGATAANRLTTTYFGASAVGTSGLGAAGGLESKPALTLTDLPQFTPSGTVSQPSGTATGGTASLNAIALTWHDTRVTLTDNFQPGTTSAIRTIDEGTPATISTLQSATIATTPPTISVTQPTFTGVAIGNVSPPASANVQPSLVMTFYIKL